MKLISDVNQLLQISVSKQPLAKKMEKLMVIHQYAVISEHHVTLLKQHKLIQDVPLDSTVHLHQKLSRTYVYHKLLAVKRLMVLHQHAQVSPHLMDQPNVTVLRVIQDAQMAKAVS